MKHDTTPDLTFDHAPNVVVGIIVLCLNRYAPVIKTMNQLSDKCMKSGTSNSYCYTTSIIQKNRILTKNKMNVFCYSVAYYNRFLYI